MKKLLLLAFPISTAFAPGCSSTPTPAPATALIIADTNRNGTLDWTDPTEAVTAAADSKTKTTWDASHGAIFLANIDDDQLACPATMGNAIASDVDLAACNDAADTVINGDDDLLDLAPVGVGGWAAAPVGTTATVAADDASASYIHLFIMRGGAMTFFDWQNGDTISADELKAGNVQMAIEATDIVRDSSVWDGTTTLTLTVTPGDGTAVATDAVELRVAPVVTRHHLAQEEQIFITKFSTDPGSIATRATLYSNMAGNGEGDGTTLPAQPPSNVYEIDGDKAYGNDFPYDDQWAQDFFEVGYMSMPTTSGQHVIDVYLRSANVYDPTNAKNPLREAGKAVFTLFRGKDAAGIQQFDIKHDQDSDSLNSFGNFETIPPYSNAGKDYPLGRIFRGNIPSFGPDPTFIKMMESQAVQPPVYIDTSWLEVGHVDETISFVKTNSPRGWTILVNDPAMAKKMLQDQSTAGNGSVLMFAGKNWLDDNNNETPAQISIDAVLADTDVMTTSDQAVASVQAELQVLEQETGITDAELIHVPFLYEPVMGASLAYQPGTVNGLYYASDTFASPDPHGPVIGGVDIFKDQFEKALAAVGVKVAWIEDWDLYHRLSGEVHCGTNSKRGLLADEKWWTSGY
ncbi:MAG TPA: protein-arginine deiminase family protein [Polyangiaceae bacterium]|jgi:protein-arginine deiminase